MFIKICSICKNDQIYKSKTAFVKACRVNSICLKCSRQQTNKNLPQNTKGYYNEKYIGKNNHMYGKNIIDIWRIKYDEETFIELCKSHAEKSKHIGIDNGMYNKRVIDIWTEKYGIDIANQKYTDWKSKLGLSGELNPAYGKPAHAKSGRGIKGWYNELFFRSLLEMQFIHYCCINQIKIKSAESNEHLIEYKDVNNNSRTYHPDFILDDVIVEIKPNNLIPYHLLKINAGYKSYGDQYKVYTEYDFPLMVNKEKLVTLVSLGTLKFVPNDYERALKNIRYYT